MAQLVNASVNNVESFDYKYDEIITKRYGHEYKFDCKITQVEKYPDLENQKGFIVRFKRVDDECQKLYFLILILREGGIFVSNAIYKGKISSKCIEQYFLQMGRPLEKTKEQLYLDEIKPYLKSAFRDIGFIKTIPHVNDSMRLKLSDKRTKEIYTNYCGEYENLPFLKPDFLLENMRTKRVSFIEVERTKHRESDFLKKLMKIKLLRRRTYFVFNGEDNYNYHTELIAKFEYDMRTALGKPYKMNMVYYTTVDELKFFGSMAFKQHI